MIKVILFDVGGVLLQDDRNTLYTKFAYLNKMPIEKMHKEYTPFIQKSYDSGIMSTKKFYKESIKKLKLKVSKKSFFKIWNTYLVPIKENIRLVKKLSKSYKIMALANTNEADCINIRKKYGLFGIKQRLYIASYKLKLKKPDKEIYLHAIKMSGCKPEECLFIDDRIENVASAKRAGINSIHYKSHNQLLKEMKKFDITYGTN